MRRKWRRGGINKRKMVTFTYVLRIMMASAYFVVVAVVGVGVVVAAAAAVSAAAFAAAFAVVEEVEDKRCCWPKGEEVAGQVAGLEQGGASTLMISHILFWYFTI